MKTFVLKKSEFVLPDDFYLRVGASNGTTSYFQHVYCSRKTFRKIEKKLEEYCRSVIKDEKKAKRAFTKLLTERMPRVCEGIKCGHVLIDTKAISAEIKEEEMVNDLATSSKEHL